jgi:signal peptidase I
VSKSQTSRHTLLIELLCLLVVVATVLVVRQTLYEPVLIPTGSMEPALQVGDRLVVCKRAYARHAPKRGDVIMFRWPEEPGENMVKRVVGLPGEYVMMLAGRVFVNWRPLEEPYVKSRPIREPPCKAKLGPDEVWVLGDNRNHSEDSRDHGPLPLKQIIGRAGQIYWPPARRGPIR